MRNNKQDAYVEHWINLIHWWTWSSEWLDIIYFLSGSSLNERENENNVPGKLFSSLTIEFSKTKTPAG